MNQMSYLRAPKPQTPPDTKPQEAAKPRIPAQSPLSWTLLALIGLLLVAVIADAPLRDFARGLAPQTIALLKQITQFGNAAWPLGVGIIALGLCALPTDGPEPRAQKLAVARLARAIVFVMSAVALSGFTAALAKNIIGRARPYRLDAGVFDLNFLAFQPSQASFPSGHSTTAVAMMVALALIWPRHGVGLVALGGLIALTRCLTGVHWLSDVCAGAALGALVTLALARRFKPERRIAPHLVRRALRARITPFRARLTALGSTTLRAAQSLWLNKG